MMTMCVCDESGCLIVAMVFPVICWGDMIPNLTLATPAFGLRDVLTQVESSDLFGFGQIDIINQK